MRTLRHATLITILFAATGCLVGPKNVTLDTSAPESLAGRLAITDAAAEMAAVKPATAWWERFNDPKLNELIGRALKANQDLEVAKERIRAARAGARGVKSALVPTVDSNSSVSKSQSSLRARAEEQDQEFFGADRYSRNYSSSIDAAYEIDIWGKNRQGIEGAKQGILAAEAAYRATVLSLVAEVAATYFEARGAEETRLLIAEEVKNREEFLEIIVRREKSGLTSPLDTRRQEVEIANVRAQLPAAETRVVRANYRLATLLGENPQTFDMESAKLAGLPVLPLVPEGLPADLMRQRPDVLRAEAVARGAAADIGVALGDMYPSLTASASAGYSSAFFGDFMDDLSDKWTLASALRLPLFDGGRRYAELEARRAQFREAVAAYRQTVLLALEEINTSLVAASKSRESRSARYAALESAREANRIAREQYRAGSIALVDLLDSQRTELQTRQLVIDADQQTVTDVVSLYKAFGGGWDVTAVDPVALPERSTGRRIAENIPLWAAGLDDPFDADESGKSGNP
ncbi:MAG: TolC family protein [Candidatus Sumerlaeia bacterium]|nr:TolC family protein [Candidatus Sumerlaeia bacterium]